MGELIPLSNDLNVITAEINSYKQMAGQAIFEIGMRIKKVHEEKIADKHGGWTEWLKQIDMSSSQADRFMKVVERIDPVKLPDVGKLSFGVLYEISTMPKTEQEKPHTIPSTGEQKTVDEMTIRELREVKQALKLAEEDKKRLGLLLQEERSKPPQISVKEVIPETIKKEVDQLKKRITVIASEKEQLEKKLNSKDYETEQLKRQAEKLKHEAHVSIYELQIKIKKFIEDAAPSLFLQGAIAANVELFQKDITASIEALESFTDQLRNILNARIDVIETDYMEV